MGDNGRKFGFGHVVRNVNSLKIGIFVHLFFDMSQVPKRMSGMVHSRCSIVFAELINGL